MAKWLNIAIEASGGTSYFSLNRDRYKVGPTTGSRAEAFQLGNVPLFCFLRVSSQEEKRQFAICVLGSSQRYLNPVRQALAGSSTWCKPRGSTCGRAL